MEEVTAMSREDILLRLTYFWLDEGVRLICKLSGFGGACRRTINITATLHRSELSGVKKDRLTLAPKTLLKVQHSFISYEAWDGILKKVVG